MPHQTQPLARCGILDMESQAQKVPELNFDRLCQIALQSCYNDSCSLEVSTSVQPTVTEREWHSGINIWKWGSLGATPQVVIDVIIYA